eukprot:383461-Prorocentrum_minimum.AAC.2
MPRPLLRKPKGAAWTLKGGSSWTVHRRSIRVIDGLKTSARKLEPCPSLTKANWTPPSPSLRQIGPLPPPPCRGRTPRLLVLHPHAQAGVHRRDSLRVVVSLPVPLVRLVRAALQLRKPLPRTRLPRRLDVLLHLLHQQPRVGLVVVRAGAGDAAHHGRVALRPAHPAREGPRRSRDRKAKPGETCGARICWRQPAQLGLVLGYPGSALGYPGSVLGYPGSALGYPGSALGYPGSALGYPGSALGYPGSVQGL